jgi:hypothetical protein
MAPVCASMDAYEPLFVTTGQIKIHQHNIGGQSAKLKLHNLLYDWFNCSNESVMLCWSHMQTAWHYTQQRFESKLNSQRHAGCYTILQMISKMERRWLYAYYRHACNTPWCNFFTRKWSQPWRFSVYRSWINALQSHLHACMVYPLHYRVSGQQIHYSLLDFLYLAAHQLNQILTLCLCTWLTGISYKL